MEIAPALLDPVVTAAATLLDLNGEADGVDLLTLWDALGKQVDAVRNGDMGRVEAMLLAQAHTLDAWFFRLARLSDRNMSEHFDAADRLMRLALRAQNQSRRTLETLAAIKNPPNVAFVGQANITAGPQQVNNAPWPDQESRARKNGNVCVFHPKPGQDFT